eukprot:1156395-Pelagomonas_calceolata.AAC.13
MLGGVRPGRLRNVSCDRLLKNGQVGTLWTYTNDTYSGQSAFQKGLACSINATHPNWCEHRLGRRQRLSTALIVESVCCVMGRCALRESGGDACLDACYKFEYQFTRADAGSVCCTHAKGMIRTLHWAHKTHAQKHFQ